MGVFYNEDEYWVEITKHGVTQAKVKKTDQLFVKFIVKGPVDHDNPEQFVPTDQEYERTLYQAITSKTIEAGMVKQTLDGLGFVGSFEAFNSDEALVGQFVKCRCKHELYKEETKERWEVSSDIERIDSKAAAKLDRLFGIQTESKPAAKQPEPPTTIQDSPPPKVKPLDVTDQPAVDAEVNSAGQDSNGGSNIPF